MKQGAISKNVEQALAKDKTTNAVREHVALLHLRGGWGLVTVAHIAPAGEEYENRWKHKINSVNELHNSVGEYAGCENVWVGLNRSGARRVVKVRYLCAMRSARDFHNISDGAAMMNVAVFPP